MGLRRKTVVGHWRDPSVVGRIGTWSRAACGWHEAQTLNVARFGDNMRHVAVTEGDKVEAQLRLGIAVDGYGIGDLVDAVRDVSDAAVDVLVDEYEHLYVLVPAAPGGWSSPRVAAGRRADRGGSARFSRDGRLQGVHGYLRGPGRPAATSRHRRAAPDGGRVRVRGGRRLEDRGARPDHQGDERRARRWHVVHGGLHVPPGAGRAAGARRAHARGVPLDRDRRSEALLRDPPALDRRKARPRSARVHSRARAGRGGQPHRPGRSFPSRRE